MENLPKEELIAIVTNVSEEKRKRKSAALVLVTKYPETGQIRFCPDCGRMETEIIESYDGLHGDMFYYRDTCPCGRTGSAPEEYDTGVCTTINEIAFM